MARDHQRQRLYASERTFFIEMAPDLGIPPPRRVVESGNYKGTPVDFITLDECKTFLTTLQSSDYYRRAGGFQRITLHSGAGNRRATYNEYKKRIKLPLWARTRWVIAHELAHHLTHRDPRDLPAHGASFARHFIELVRVGSGETCANGLESQFAIDGLDVRDLADMKIKPLKSLAHA